jgi:UDP-N-acetylmuramoyl-tripeptide--D-alanyl-D-alanine ligase
MRLALDVLRDLPGPHAAVLGDMRELGSESERHHALLAEACQGVDPLFAVGEHSRVLARPGGRGRHYPDVDAAIADADALPTSGTLLVKASRGIELDRLVDALVARHTAHGSPEGAR